MIADNRTKVSLFDKAVLPWLVCGIGILFYCYNYFLRVSPSVMQNDLTQTFHITATQFGTLAGFYYFAYTAMQVPAGMIYDKFGARFVLFLACLTAVVGLAIFIAADSFAIAGAGRFLIGIGTAFSYIGVLKLASIWLPPNRFATVAGITTAVGMACGALSQKYLSKVVEVIGYKHALHTALLLGLGLSVAILLIIRSRPKQVFTKTNKAPTPLTLNQLMAAVRIIVLNPQMWLIGIVGCLLYLPASVFLDLWGIPYLKTVYMLTSQQAATVSELTFLGWIISGPVVGIISDKIKRRRMPLIISGVLAATLLCVIFYVPGITVSELYIIFFAAGFSCGAHPLCFALSKENNPAQASGTAVAVTNMLIMAGGAIFQPVVGKLLDMHSTTIGANGLPVYVASDYTFALSVIPLGVALGIIVSAFLKETHCESHESVTERKSQDAVTDVYSNVIPLTRKASATH
jgi:MFS family permease